MIAKKSRGLWSDAETTLWSHTHTHLDSLIHRPHQQNSVSHYEMSVQPYNQISTVLSSPPGPPASFIVPRPRREGTFFGDRARGPHCQARPAAGVLGPCLHSSTSSARAPHSSARCPPSTSRDALRRTRRSARRPTGLRPGLAARGIAPGDRVGLYCVNSDAFAIAYFGILKAGATVVVPVNLLLNFGEGWI